ncbi:sensor histidine kinase [Pseudomonas fontis]|uniref:histidine kinase n=1 Tax=Pseudomonas fontis TaxID=2942633 RepID=A0ABT5NPD0_9PSED|nr:HAMP domain-containing sensor histidine kinase [Pseudomonas fontis]MDD0973732.1 HAMP domain-containing histidine kinase [Pseudomonas fontis]MDD0990034.1 HAMP domain-containing histidine kinase [Pseudomonas fontis]
MSTDQTLESATLRTASTPVAPERPAFNLLRWYAVVSLAVIVSVAVGLGLISSRFVINESVERDALLTAQFIQSIASAEVRHVAIPNIRTMGELLDPRLDEAFPDVTPESRRSARWEFLDHIAHLPDVLLANIYAPDRTVIWSTNPALIGKLIDADEDLDHAFDYKVRVSASYHNIDDARSEQKFIVPPQNLFIENYIPLFDNSGEHVTAMVEIYKEPRDLIERIENGLLLIWLGTALGAGVVYFSLYLIVRRAAILLAVQQKQLINNETYIALGEMSSAVAHSLRNPLASIRSSAELALEFDDGAAHKNINDIIFQVDRMSQWVRELLQSLRPLTDELEEVDLQRALRESLNAYRAALDAAHITLQVGELQGLRVLGQTVMLVQVFNSLIANALEAMPDGGELRLEVARQERKVLSLRLSDTGKGMSGPLQRMAFKPFFTTKQGGLGVGLVLVKRIMERFGGSVRLSSREGEGTCVLLTFRVPPR